MNSAIGRCAAVAVITVLWFGCSSNPTEPEKSQATLSGTVNGFYCWGLSPGEVPINSVIGEAATVRVERDGATIQTVDTDSLGEFHLALEAGTYDIITSSAITYPPDTVQGIVIDADTSIAVRMHILTTDPRHLLVSFHYALSADSLGQEGEKAVVIALNRLTADDGQPPMLAYPEDGPSGQFWRSSSIHTDMWVSYEIPIDYDHHHVANAWLKLKDLKRSDQTSQFDPVVIDFAGEPWICLQ